MGIFQNQSNFELAQLVGAHQISRLGKINFDMKLLFKVWYLLGQQAMSKIPYVFLAIPHEFLTEDFLKDPVMIRFIVWVLKRISPNLSLLPLKGQSKLLRLDPFEFMFCREACVLAAGISLKNARTRIKQLN